MRRGGGEDGEGMSAEEEGEEEDMSVVYYVINLVKADMPEGVEPLGSFVPRIFSEVVTMEDLDTRELLLDSLNSVVGESG